MSAINSAPLSPRIREICALQREGLIATKEFQEAAQAFREISTHLKNRQERISEQERSAWEQSEQQSERTKIIHDEKIRAMSDKVFEFIIGKGNRVDLAKALYPNNQSYQKRYIERLASLLPSR